jgi:hypothetical protein
MLMRPLEFKIELVEIIYFENQHTPSRTFVRDTQLGRVVDMSTE